MDNVILFDNHSVSSAVLAKMENTAFSAFAFHPQRPFFFLHIRNMNLIAELEELGNCKGETKGAGTVTIVFFNPEIPGAEIDACIALGSFNEEGIREGLSFAYLPSFRLLFNDPRHKELLRLCGVPNGYFCIGAQALGKPKKVEEIPENLNNNHSAYVQ